MPPKQETSGRLASLFSSVWGFLFGGGSKETAKTPVEGVGQRVTNAIKYSWRGMFGFLIPIILVPMFWSKTDNARKVEIMWCVMFWFVLVRPVSVPVTGLVPVFFLPMTGVYSTLATCSCYMSENIVLYLMGGILILLLNNSGVDRRIALSFMAGGDNVDQFTAKKLVYKCSMAAFLLSFLSSRLLASAMITEYVTKSLMAVETKFSPTKDAPDIREIRYVVNNAIQTSSSIGSAILMHSAYGVLAFRSLFCERGIAYKDSEYPDIFNYLQYSAFALPLCVVIFIVNLLYFYYLIGREQIQKQLREYQSKLPKSLTLHETLTIIALIITLFFIFYRWSVWLGGWSTFQGHKKLTFRNEPLPAIKDATAAATFVVIFHTLPMGFNFTKYFTASKRSELPPLKQESGILWWRFSDKNLNYSYFFLIGAGNALVVAMIKTGLTLVICENVGRFITDMSWNLAIFVVLLVACILFSIMPETAALCVYMPFILALADGPMPWPTHVYLPSLGLGILANFGFMYPFRYSPAYSCHYIGKTPIKRMMLHGIGSIIICFVLVYLSVLFIAPSMWDPDDVGIPPSSPPAATTPPSDAA